MALLLTGIAGSALARTGYKIQLRSPELHEQMVYLTHYYGKPLPTIYKKDSARFDKNGIATFNNADTGFLGGIYMMLLADRKTYFEFLLNDGDDMTITVDTAQLPQGLRFQNSPENERFAEYLAFLKGYGANQVALKKEYAAARTAADTAAVRAKAATAAKNLTSYRHSYAQQHPGTLLANIFNALEAPKVPEGPHYLPDGVTPDSTFAYTYYKKHFWDNFNFRDDRLIHTPIYDAKITEYMSKMVLPGTDSVEKEAAMLLKASAGTRDMFKYTLFWLTRWVEDSKIMGMDEVYVYLVENYYMKGDAYWVTPDELTRCIDRAQKIAPNVIGNLAPEVKLPNVITRKEESLTAMAAPYTLLVFYSPTCGHCQQELPALDSLCDAVLKKKGVKVFTVATEGDEKSITDFLVKIKVDKKWTNTWDHDHVSDYHNKYDVYSTPTIYLLDEKKIIRGKRIDHSNIAEVVTMLEAKDQHKKNNTKKQKT